MNRQVNKASPRFAPDAETLVTRFGLRVTASLNEQARTLPHDVSERLRFAREQALTMAQSNRASRAVPVTSAQAVQPVQNGSTMALMGLGGPGEKPSQGWLKFVSFLPLVGLVAGILLIQHGQWDQQVRAAAEIDAALLSDNLPPAAYGDPGFSEYLSDEQE